MVASFTLENCVTKSTLVSSCVIKVAEYHTSFLRRILMRFRVGMSVSALPSYCGLRPAQIICGRMAVVAEAGVASTVLPALAVVVVVQDVDAVIGVTAWD
jgi:hypothetical protein